MHTFCESNICIYSINMNMHALYRHAYLKLCISLFLCLYLLVLTCSFCACPSDTRSLSWRKLTTRICCCICFSWCKRSTTTRKVSEVGSHISYCILFRPFHVSLAHWCLSHPSPASCVEPVCGISDTPAVATMPSRWHTST